MSVRIGIWQDRCPPAEAVTPLEISKGGRIVFSRGTGVGGGWFRCTREEGSGGCRWAVHGSATFEMSVGNGKMYTGV